ncbi:late exocytosis, associated with Golgi transport-domain-containing protein, partial [Auriculariales sp. MPI-PUGE-AT-0066]
SPTGRHAGTFEGPWLTMQLSPSCGIGLFSFVVFSFCRRRWPLLFSPRTKLKDFSPHEAHLGNSSSAWIIPTIHISELSVLQIVGLDAAVLLNFLKTSFYLFLSCALLILMPINYYVGKSLVDGDDWISDGLDGGKPSPPPPDWHDLITDANAFLVVQFIFTCAFSLLTMRFLLANYHRFVRARQLFSLELVHSIAACTVLVSFLPPHLRGECALVTYYENMGFAVESVSVCHDVGALMPHLDKCMAALLKLEHSWTKYVGNPCAVEA